MNMKQLKAACPDLMSTSYSSAHPNFDAIVSQLHSAGMMPAVWALEELLEANGDLEDAVEASAGVEEERDEALKVIAELEEELGRYKDFFRAVVEAFEGRPAERKAWPWPEPHDEALVQVITEALGRDPGEPPAED